MSKLEKRFYEDVVVSGMKDGTLVDYKLQVKYNLQESFKYMGKTIRAIDYISDFDLYYKLYGWDCDSIVIMNPDIVVEL